MPCRGQSRRWASPGAGSGSHDSAVVGSIDQPAGGTPHTVEIDPDVVESWLQNPTENYGLLLASDDSTPCSGWFMSAEASNPDERPRLRVVYRESLASDGWWAPAALRHRLSAV